MSWRVRLTAAAGALCLGTAVVAALALPHAPARVPAVRVRSLSSTDVVAVPAHASPGRLEARVVVLGDSVGTDAGCGCQPFGPRLAPLLADRLKEPVRVADLAQDGQTSAGLLDQLTTDAATVAAVRAAAAVTVVVGANDFDADDAGTACAGTGTACFDQALAALPEVLDRAVSRIRSLAGPHVRILVLGYWNVFLDGTVGAQQGSTYQRTSDALTRRVDAAIAGTATRASATYVDLYSAFRADGSRDDTALLAPDGDHPSAAGHQRIAELLAGYLSVAAG